MTDTRTDRPGDRRVDTVEGTATSRVVRPGSGRGRRRADRRSGGSGGSSGSRATFGPASSRGRRAFTLRQLVVLELAAVAVVATVFPWQPVRTAAIVVASVALVAVLVTWIRWRGRSLDQWTWRVLAFRARALRSARSARRGRAAVDPDDAGTIDALDPVLAGLDLVGLSVRAHVDRAGNRAGVVVLTGTDSLSGVVRLAPGVDPDPARMLTALRAAFDRPDIPIAAAQLVAWTVPGPSHGSLLRVHWLALRYLPAAGPAAALARGGGMPGAIRATAMAALGLARDLTEAGAPAAPLGVRELRGELGVAAGLDPLVLTGAETAPEPAEAWREWSAGSIHQATYRPRRGGGVGEHLELLSRHATGTAFTCVSTTLRRDLYGSVSEELLVRLGVAVAPGRTDARTSLATAAASLGTALVPLVGEQARGVRRTLPLALR